MDYKLSSLTSQIVQPDVLLKKPNENRLYIDVRLGDPEEEHKSYRDAHILGAVYAQIRDIFAAVPTLDSGNLPLPNIDDLQRRLQDWGVDAQTELVLYGPSPALAARGWWVLRWAGLQDVKVLDGGLKAWVAHGGPVAQGSFQLPRRPTAKGLVLTPGNMPSISVDEVDALYAEVMLIDARDEASYLSGCIPRALNLPSAKQWTPSAKLRTTREIRMLYDEGGIRDHSEVVVYCGGGVLSALTVLTLSALGRTPRLFVGSWSQWNKSPVRMARSASERVTL